MSGILANDGDHSDSDESFISQFETTLTIRPSSDLPEDLSIDHTTYFEEPPVTKVDEECLNIHIQRDSHSNKERESKTSLRRDLSTKVKLEVQGSESFDNIEQSRSAFADILEPSPLIDSNLDRFKRTFHEFIEANPHIERESPKFDNPHDKTLVILSPLSSEHVFGRKWVNKSYLSTIFERPQRLLASCIGVAAALTMYPYYYQVINSTERGSLFADHVRKVHGRTWPSKLFELCLESHSKLLDDEIEIPEEWNSGDIYLTPKTINALEGVLGTIETAVDCLYGLPDDSKNHNLGFVVIRPPGHHSHACLPSGFCVMNNAQIGIEYAFSKYGVSHCAILDIDLHHGDGSQDICWERAGYAGDHGKSDNEFDDSDENPRNEYGKKFSSYPKVGYFSLHDIKSYPTEIGFASKEHIRNASTCVMDHEVSLWNVHLQEWSSEDEFYKHYQTKYVAILNRANQFLNQAKKQHVNLHAAYLAELSKYNRYLMKPHLHKHAVKKPSPPPPFKPLIIMSSGFDASEYENPQMQRHSVNVPTSFYAKFTKDVVKLAKLHTAGKVLSFLEGGYSDGALISGIFSHLIGLLDTKDEPTDDELLWNDTWGSEHVVKELSKGCKKSWVPYKNPKAEITVWANEVIKMGRSMMPNAILHPAYNPYGRLETNIAGNFENLSGKRILKGIIDFENYKEVTSPSKDPDDERRVMRHTRSYYRKNTR